MIISISNHRFNKKPKDWQYATMIWRNIIASLSEVKEIIERGYAISQEYIFNNLFSASERSEDNIKSICFIAFDYDNCYYDWNTILQAFNNNPVIVPTFFYRTMSDGEKGKGRRYRMIYFLDEQIDKETYYSFYYVLKQRILSVLPKMVFDGAMESPNQMALGAKKNSVVYQSDRLVSTKEMLSIIKEKGIVIRPKEKGKTTTTNAKTEKSKLVKEILDAYKDFIEKWEIEVDDDAEQRKYLTNNKEGVDWLFDNTDVVGTDKICRVSDYIEIPSRYSIIKKQWRHKTFSCTFPRKFRTIKPDITFPQLVQQMTPWFILCEKGTSKDDKEYTNYNFLRDVANGMIIDFGTYNNSIKTNRFTARNVDNVDKETGEIISRKTILSEQLHQLIDDMVAKGDSINDIAESIGKSDKYVDNYLLKKKREDKRTKNKELLDAYDLNKSIRQNAKDLGITLQVARRMNRDLKTTNVVNIN